MLQALNRRLWNLLRGRVRRYLLRGMYFGWQLNATREQADDVRRLIVNGSRGDSLLPLGRLPAFRNLKHLLLVHGETPFRVTTTRDAEVLVGVLAGAPRLRHLALEMLTLPTSDMAVLVQVLRGIWTHAPRLHTLDPDGR